MAINSQCPTEEINRAVLGKKQIYLIRCQSFLKI